METKPNEKKVRSANAKTNTMLAIRVKKETAKVVQDLLKKLNKKDFGRRVRADELISLAVTLVTPEHHKQLQDATLSEHDRVKREFREHCSKNGNISFEQYIGELRRKAAAFDAQNHTSGNAENARV